MVNVSEETIYCSHCGAANKKSAVICTSCENKIHTKYRPFYDFLKKHTKEELKGSITDTVFSVLGKYLFSHLYGITLSVTIVAATVSGVYAAQPHIEKISAPATIVEQPTQQPTQQQEQQEPEVVETPFTENDLYTFYHLAGNVDAFADLYRESFPHWGADGSVYSSADEMYAENNIPNFNFGGVHQMVSSPVSMYIEDPFADNPPASLSSDRYLDEKSAVQGGACTTAIAKTLLDAGYRVAECNYILADMDGDYDSETHTGGSIIKKLVYKFVYVEHEGEWYIAEDRLIENIGG